MALTSARLKILSVLIFALSVGFFSSFAQAQNFCGRLFVPSSSTDGLNSRSDRIALKIMLEGSLNVSRTKVVGRRFIAPKDVEDHRIAELAEENFTRAARYMLINKSRLEIDLNTATTLNRMLTRDLVPEEVRGYYNYRPKSSFAFRADSSIASNPTEFYAWLNTPAAKSMAKANPIALADIIHNSVAALDSFPDGNGRLSRLFADLVLVRAGMAPAYYTNMADYFDRGNARSDVTRSERTRYYNEIVARGQKTMDESLR